MTREIIFLIVLFTIYFIRNALLYVSIRKTLLDFLQYQQFLCLSVITVNILFIVKLFLILLDIFSAITPVSAIAQISLFLFTVSITYQNLLLLSLQRSYEVHFPISYPYQAQPYPYNSLVIVLASPLSSFYQNTVPAITQSHHLFTRGNSTMHLYEISCHPLVSTTFITYSYLFPK